MGSYEIPDGTDGQYPEDVENPYQLLAELLGGPYISPQLGESYTPPPGSITNNADEGEDGAYQELVDAIAQAMMNDPSLMDPEQRAGMQGGANRRLQGEYGQPPGGGQVPGGLDEAAYWPGSYKKDWNPDSRYGLGPNAPGRNNSQAPGEMEPYPVPEDPDAWETVTGGYNLGIDEAEMTQRIFEQLGGAGNLGLVGPNGERQIRLGEAPPPTQGPNINNSQAPDEMPPYDPMQDLDENVIQNPWDIDAAPHPDAYGGGMYGRGEALGGPWAPPPGMITNNAQGGAMGPPNTPFPQVQPPPAQGGFQPGMEEPGWAPPPGPMGPPNTPMPGAYPMPPPSGGFTPGEQEELAYLQQMLSQMGMTSG